MSSYIVTLFILTTFSIVATVGRIVPTVCGNVEAVCHTRSATRLCIVTLCIVKPFSVVATVGRTVETVCGVVETICRMCRQYVL